MTGLDAEVRDVVRLEVARAAQQVKPKPAIVIYTGFASIPNSRAALELGVDYMAHKPVDVTDLISALNRLVAKRALGVRK